MEERKRVLVAMSGGVDSSVAALLLRRAGYACAGLTMRLYREAGFETQSVKSCCSDRDEEDAAFVCSELGLEHESLCLTGSFAQEVIGRFVRDYEAGRTPNPCIDCNRTMKFDALLDHAQQQGFDCIATGHYARVTRDEESGRWQLKKALDPQKDQSYVLYMLSQEQLSRLLLPLGALSKAHVRALAEEAGLVNAAKHDSQDICFIPDGDYGAFLQRWTGHDYPPGDILDREGRVLGRHRGLVRYTVGQRRGLGVAAAEPLYVLAKDAARNALIVGPESALFRRVLLAEDFRWLSIPAPEGPIRAAGRCRYHQAESPATATPLPGGQLRIEFDAPQRAPSPGQAVVLYDGDLVLGGGTIAAVE